MAAWVMGAIIMSELASMNGRRGKSIAWLALAAVAGILLWIDGQ